MVMREAVSTSLHLHMDRTSSAQPAAGLGMLAGMGVGLVIPRHLHGGSSSFQMVTSGGLNPGSVTFTTPRTWHPHIYERPPRQPTSFRIVDILGLSHSFRRHQQQQQDAKQPRSSCVEMAGDRQGGTCSPVLLTQDKACSGRDDVNKNCEKLCSNNNHHGSNNNNNTINNNNNNNSSSSSSSVSPCHSGLVGPSPPSSGSGESMSE